MAKGITASEMGKRGGATRAQRYSKGQIGKWGKLGGRPPKLGRKAMARLQRMLATGRRQSECAKVFGVSTRTIGRIVARTAREDTSVRRSPSTTRRASGAP